MHQVNPVFRPAFATDARYRIIYGGAGSSKSVSTAQDFVRRAGSTGDVRVLVVRKVYRTCRNSTFKLFCDILRALGRYRMVAVNKQEMTYHGAQSALWRKEFRVRNGAREASIMGPESLLDHTDDAPVFGGAPEVRQRRPKRPCPPYLQLSQSQDLDATYLCLPS